MRSKQSWKQSTKSRKQWATNLSKLNFTQMKKFIIERREERIREYKNNWERESLTNGEIVSCKISVKEKREFLS